MGRKGVTDSTATTTRSTVTRYLDALNRADVDAIAACVADGFYNEHTSALGTSVHGRQAYRERLPRFLSQFTGLHYDLEDLVVEQERAAARYHMSCSWLDDSGREHPVAIRGMFWFRVLDGEIVHRIDYWDGSEFSRQVATS